jgi:hypothetical protein
VKVSELRQRLRKLSPDARVAVMTRPDVECDARSLCLVGLDDVTMLNGIVLLWPFGLESDEEEV